MIPRIVVSRNIMDNLGGGNGGGGEGAHRSGVDIAVGFENDKDSPDAELRSDIFPSSVVNAGLFPSEIIRPGLRRPAAFEAPPTYVWGVELRRHASVEASLSYVLGVDLYTYRCAEKS